MGDLITIATFHNEHEFHIIKSKLQARGIECVAKDENVSRLQYSVAVGGIKLMVHEQNIGRALEILKESSYENQLENSSTQQGIVHQLNKIGEKLPLIKFLPYPMRGLLLVVLIVIGLVGIIFSMIN